MILSAARLKTNGLHLGHFLGSFSHRSSNNRDNSGYIFVIEDLFPFNRICGIKNYHFASSLIEDVYVCANLTSYDIHVVFLSDIISYKSPLNSLLLEHINVNHIRSVHPKRNYLRFTSDNISLSDFLFIFHEAYYIIGLDVSDVYMNDDNLAFINYIRSVTKRINNKFNIDLSLPYLVTGRYSRLKGIDGERMSKSRANEIYLRDNNELLKQKIESMFTSRKAMKSVRCDSSGKYRHIDSPISNNFIPFQYLDVFDKHNSESIKKAFISGQINIHDVKNSIIKSLIRFTDKYNQELLSFKQHGRVIDKLNSDLDYVLSRIKKTDSKILNCVK